MPPGVTAGLGQETCSYRATQYQKGPVSDALKIGTRKRQHQRQEFQGASTSLFEHRITTPSPRAQPDKRSFFLFSRKKLLPAGTKGPLLPTTKLSRKVLRYFCCYRNLGAAGASTPGNPR